MYAEKKLDVLMTSLVPFCILNSDNWHVKGAGILCHGCIQYLSHMGVRGELYATTVRQDNEFCERVLSGSYSSDRISVWRFGFCGWESILYLSKDTKPIFGKCLLPKKKKRKKKILIS